MIRYSGIPWPFLGLAVALTLIGQEALFGTLGPTKTFAPTAYRMIYMAIGVTCLALLLLPPRRIAYFLGALVCAALMGWALWLQYGLGEDPCPLCSVQRMAVIAIGVIFLIAAAHNPGRLWAAIYAGLVLVVGAFGTVIAFRHVWIQHLPKDQVPACGMGLDYMLETLPLGDVFTKLFKGTGECAQAGWQFLGLAIPAWTFVFFVAMTITALVLARRE
ncbi:MAG: disulfide bond formation protein B [Pseudomonadota bacterium]|nr:disulfide bond formation protein B [Pseudomonadota bacterium]